MTKGKPWKRVWRVADYYAAIIAGVEQGKTLKAIARGIPARPSTDTLQNFLRRCPVRWARYQAARAAAGRLHRIPEETYTAALRALAITNVPHLKKWNEPGLPNLDTLRARAHRDPGFKRRLDAALELRHRRVRKKRFSLADHERALQFIARHAGKSQIEIDPLLRAAHLPSIDAIRARARSVPAFREKIIRLNETRGIVRHTPESYQSALAALRADPHTAVERILPERAGLIPSAVHLRLHLRRDPVFAARYRAVMDERRNARGRTLPSIRRIRPVGSISTSVTSDLVTRAQAAIPRWVDRAMHDDVRSELILAVLSGECSASDLPTLAPRIIQRVVGTTWQAMRSLNEQIGDTGQTLLDLRTSDRYTFEDAI